MNDCWLLVDTYSNIVLSPHARYFLPIHPKACPTNVHHVQTSSVNQQGVLILKSSVNWRSEEQQQRCQERRSLINISVWTEIGENDDVTFQNWNEEVVCLSLEMHGSSPTSNVSWSCGIHIKEIWLLSLKRLKKIKIKVFSVCSREFQISHSSSWYISFSFSSNWKSGERSDKTL